MKKIIESYTVEEVVEALKLHPYTIRRLCREKKILVLNLVDNGDSEKTKSISGHSHILLLKEFFA